MKVIISKLSHLSFKQQQEQQQRQQQPQQVEKNRSINAGLKPLEKTFPKLNVIKSRAVHDSNVGNAYVSFTLQDELTNNKLKWLGIDQLLI